MKFLLMGDRHNSEHVPENRIDDYLNSTKNKDLEIKQIAEKYKVKAILQAGDFWSDGDKSVSKSLISAIIKRWYGLDIESNESKAHTQIPIISIAGNHDLIGNSLRSLPETTAGLMDALGHIPLATRTPIFFEEDGIKVAITGNPCHLNMDKTADEYIIDRVPDVDAHIHIVHGMLTPKSYGTLFSHTTIDKILSTGADITFCGHDHIGWPTVEHAGKFFVNPGAVIRSKNDVKEMSRQVKVVIVDITKAGIKFEEIPLKSALPANLVLNREIVEQKKAKADSLVAIKDEISKMNLTSRSDITVAIQDVCDSEKVSDDVKTDISKRINEQQLKLNPSIVAPQNAQIKRIELENFQSHKNTVINLEDGFNVIVGESRQGKSSILRALRWVYENKPSGNRFIRRGQTKMSVTVVLQNGTIVKRQIDKDANTYRLIMPDGTTHNGNTKLLKMVQDALGYSLMAVDSTLSLPLNFMRQGTSWYLIGEEYSSIDRARILGALQGTNAADAVAKEYDKENLQIDSRLKANQDKIKSEEEQVLELSDELELLNKIKKLLDNVELVEMIHELFAFVSESHIHTTRLLELEKFDVKAAEMTKNMVSELRVKHEFIVEQLEATRTFKKELVLQTDAYNKLPVITSNPLKELFSEFSVLSEAHTTFSKESKRLSGIVKLTPALISESTKPIETVLTIYFDVLENVKLLSKSQEALKKSENFLSKTEDSSASSTNGVRDILLDLATLTEMVANTRKLKKLELVASEKEKEYSGLIDKKIDILMSAGICPTCHQSLEKKDTNKIIERMRA